MLHLPPALGEEESSQTHLLQRVGDCDNKSLSLVGVQNREKT